MNYPVITNKKTGKTFEDSKKNNKATVPGNNQRGGGLYRAL